MSEREIDQALVERAQGGEQHAFDQLVSKYQRKLGRLLSRFIRDPAEVGDVTQEAFIKAYRALPVFAATARSIPGFIASASTPPRTTWYPRAPGADHHRIRFRGSRNFRRRRPTKGYQYPESVLLSKQIGETVNAAMDALPEELRTAIVLREIEGMSYEEIAQIMKCPIGTVRFPHFPRPRGGRRQTPAAARHRPGPSLVMAAETTTVAAVVRALDGSQAVVEVETGGLRPLPRKGGCGGQQLTQMMCSSPKTYHVDNPAGAAIGDRVTIAIAAGAVRRSANLAYVFPVVGLIAGAGLAVGPPAIRCHGRGRGPPCRRLVPRPFPKQSGAGNHDIRPTSLVVPSISEVDHP